MPNQNERAQKPRTDPAVREFISLWVTISRRLTAATNQATQEAA